MGTGMASVSDESGSAATGWQPIQVYGMAAACLLLGLAAGYLFRGSESTSIATRPATAAQAEAAAGAGQMLTLDEMRHMADKKAEPLLAKLKSDPEDADLLTQVGNIYKSTHQFKQAVAYYDKSLRIKPGNVGVRNELASCLYYEGDANGAIQQLEHSLKDDPGNANSLFNLGLIKWKARQDQDGALAAWQQLLQANPYLPDKKKAEVKEAIASLRQAMAKEQ
jgi:cytochrome c-type biogenesis protein CcmH/NrfG